jgi:hypothetical protein
MADRHQSSNDNSVLKCALYGWVDLGKHHPLVAVLGNIMANTYAVSTTEAVHRMRLFNEKADKLDRCSFVEKVFKKDHGFTIHFGEDQSLNVERTGADEGATDALSLTLRFFFNKKDGIAIEQMKDLYESLPIPEEEKVKARNAFVHYERILDAPIGVNFKGTILTNWNVIETILYGDLAHANDDKRPIFEEWRSAAPFYTLVNFFLRRPLPR